MALASSSQAQQFSTIPFARQEFRTEAWKAAQRFGKTEDEVVAMGHDRFVAWYCDDARAGKTGRVEAEKVYGLALTECSAPFLLRLSRPEQKFMEDAICAMADMAKSSVTTAVMSFGEDKDWGMSFAVSSVAVSETVYALVNPKVPLPPEPKLDWDRVYRTVNEKTKARNPGEEDGAGRLKFVAGYVEKVFKDRSPREKALTRAFAAKAALLALHEPQG
ncbi:MAG: hypothetical protein ACO1SV_14365 [Fimbriimonas sp.]